MLADTPVGPVVGRAHDGVRGIRAFGGVPYARAGRFGLPEAVAWSVPLDATRRGAAPPQLTSEPALVPGLVPDRTTEQCLTAEIWTPDTDAAAPVLVWIPGGSFLTGGAGLPTYDGARLAADGQMVVVGLNYRLGLLGFLPDPEVPSNLGLRDLRAALAWIRANIGAFGGDPNQVTLMGESAGAGAITHLLATPGLAAHRAIVASASPGSTLTRDQAEHVAAGVAEVASMAELRTMPLDDLLAVQEAACAQLLGSVGMMPFHPRIDDDLLASGPMAASLAPLPVIIGTTRHEMELFRDRVPELPRKIARTMLERKAAAIGVPPERADAALTAAGDDLVEAIADIELHLPAVLLANRHAAAGHPVHRYSFGWEAPVHRACHALDLPFMFGTLDVDGWRAFAGADDPAADRLSTHMRASWASFAHGRRPDPAWPRHRPGSPTVWLFGAESGPGADPHVDRFAAWTGPHGT